MVLVMVRTQIWLGLPSKGLQCCSHRFHSHKCLNCCSNYSLFLCCFRLTSDTFRFFFWSALMDGENRWFPLSCLVPRPFTGFVDLLKLLVSWQKNSVMMDVFPSGLLSRNHAALHGGFLTALLSRRVTWRAPTFASSLANRAVFSPGTGPIRPTTDDISVHRAVVCRPLNLFVQSHCLMATLVSCCDTKKCWSRSGSKGTSKVERVGPVPSRSAWSSPGLGVSQRLRRVAGQSGRERSRRLVKSPFFSQGSCGLWGAGPVAPRSALVFGLWRHWKRWSGKTTSTRVSMRTKMTTPSCKRHARHFQDHHKHQ